MIALLQTDCTLRQKADIVSTIERAGFRVHLDHADGREWIGVVGARPERIADELASLPGVAEVKPVALPYAFVSRDYHPENTTIRVGEVELGGNEVCMIAGPCSVETREQVLATARSVAAHGAHLLRGGAFKPRSSPYSFQGLGEPGLQILAEARAETGLAFATEVVATEDVELVARYADVLQVGARNMQNFRLLQALGRQPQPVLLKRGLSATLDELLQAAEYVVEAGNPQVILCERGIRTFERATRNTFDVGAIPVLKHRTHLPVIADPSHACGIRAFVPALAKSALAAGADGLIVEVHPEPEKALSDGAQSLTPDGFGAMMRELAPLGHALDRPLAPPVQARPQPAQAPR